MYTHTPMVLQQMSQQSQHQSTARIRVPSGPFGLAEQGLLVEHFFLFQNFEKAECHSVHTASGRQIPPLLAAGPRMREIT